MDFVETDQNKVVPDKRSGGMDFDSQWDDNQLTPVNSAQNGFKHLKTQSTESEKEISDVLSEGVKQNILSGFKELEESFMYLGVLKKLALPDARRFFESKFDDILKLFHQIWENQVYPEKDQLFYSIGEDYQKLNRLIHSGDAINPIYDNLKTVYQNVEHLRDAGFSLQECMGLLRKLFNATK